MDIAGFRPQIRNKGGGGITMKLRKTNISLFANIVERTFSDAKKYRELKIRKSNGYWIFTEVDAYTGARLTEVLLGISEKCLLHEFLIVRKNSTIKTLKTAKTLEEALAFVNDDIFKKRYHIQNQPMLIQSSSRMPSMTLMI